MSWFITNLFASLLLPPLNLFLVMALGISLLHIHPKLAHCLLIGSFSLLWLCATPYVSEAGLHLLEKHATPLASPPPTADAIVILGGGSYFQAPEYANRDIAGTYTLLRLHYGTKLYQETHLPILVTGGMPQGNNVSESQQMRDILEQDFQVPVTWSEDASANTFENASNTFKILQKVGITKIYLVTHAWHIPRAAQIYRHVGFDVIEAPTVFTTRYQVNLLAFLPSAGALENSSIFAHEMIGLVWYQLRSWINPEV